MAKAKKPTDLFASQKAKLFAAYLRDLSAVHRPGDAREESFYSTLVRLIDEIAKATGRQNIQITVQPRPTEAGNPDFRVWDGERRIVGYIEAKPPTAESLDHIERTDQLKRYRETFPNLILTNFLEFRLYRNGERVAEAQLGRPVVLTALRHTPPVENPDAVWALLDQFLAFSLPCSLTAETLAQELAKRTRFLRNIVGQQLREERQSGKGTLLGFFDAFQKYLIASLTAEEFADFYAQTLTYGLFAARTRAPEGFSRRKAFDHIPATLGVLRDLFRYISLGDSPEELVWIVDDIAEVLSVADITGMIARYAQEQKGSDPVIHFYETFLACYDPKERESRGVYYTPEPAVSYIVRSLHQLLKEQFGKADGLAAPDVTLLDPAAGTMTFVARAAEEAVEEFESKYGSGGRAEFIRNHILKNFHAFELMMAPYAVGHLKIAFLLEELGYRLQAGERVPFYLTNTLEMAELASSNLPGLASLAEESHLAGEVKRKPILVILGNPPYSGHSANNGEWIRKQIETYKEVDGKPLGERNSKWLQDDYVKFIRFAQWKIEQAGAGVVGMITNHAYLDNPTFRGMRRSLMQTFDEIYVLDLHGNALKRERCPDGSPDENVFDIRQGVAIAFFVKTGSGGTATVRHAELWGLREAKYEWLHAHDVRTTPWTETHPKPEFYLFVPRDEDEQKHYKTFIKITDIFPLHGAGMTTARDEFVIDFDKHRLKNRILLFKHSKDSDEDLHLLFQIREKKGWSIRRAWQMLQEVPEYDVERLIVPVMYRPFDVRHIFYHDSVVWRTVKRVMRHMLAGENVALIVPRQNKGDFGAFATTVIGTHKTVAAFDINSYFPLFLYPADSKQDDLFTGVTSAARRPNLNPELVAALAEAYGKSPTPEEILHYVYAVLYAPSYRERYADFLRLDFPRIPFPAARELFSAVAGLGARLVSLHLLRSPELDPPLARFEGQGENGVEGIGREGLRYEEKTERVFINATQYFAPVPREVWQYAIGGYQVAEKWLKDRRDRRLTLDEIRTYCRILTALYRTIALQAEIDAYYAQIEEQTLPLGNTLLPRPTGSACQSVV